MTLAVTPPPAVHWHLTVVSQMDSCAYISLCVSVCDFVPCQWSLLSHNILMQLLNCAWVGNQRGLCICTFPCLDRFFVSLLHPKLKPVECPRDPVAPRTNSLLSSDTSGPQCQTELLISARPQILQLGSLKDSLGFLLRGISTTLAPWAPFCTKYKLLKQWIWHYGLMPIGNFTQMLKKNLR